MQGRKIAVTGAAGLLGAALIQVGRALGAEVVALTRQDLDITDTAAPERVVKALKPDCVIHCAAIPDPDLCETNPIQAYAVNAGGTENIVRACRASGATLVHISTDSVFDGVTKQPCREDDPKHAVNVYGRTKLAAETAVAELESSLIVRICVLFGPQGVKAPDSVTKAIEKVGKGERVRAASDQVSTATYTVDAARVIYRCLTVGVAGPLHVCNSGICSRYELVRQALIFANLDPALVEPISIADLKRPAKRTEYAALATSRLVSLGFPPPRPWQDALQEHIRATLL